MTGSLAVLILLLMNSNAFALGESAAMAPPVTNAELQVLVTMGNHRGAGEQLQVYLLNRVSQPKQLTFTDSGGRAWFHVVEPGEYRVRVSGRSILDVTSSEFTLDDSHPSKVEVLETKPRVRAIYDAKVSNSSVTSASDLAVPPNARKCYHDALEAWRHNNFAKAKSLFQKAIDLYPQYDAAYNNLGVVYVQLNDNNKAWVAFQKAVNINDRNPDADRNLSRLLIQTGAYDRAQQLLRKSLMVDPLNAGALTLVSSLKLKTGDYEGALKTARKVHELPHEGFAVAHYYAGQALEHGNRLQEAAAEYEMYLRESPQGPEAEDVKTSLSRLGSSTQAKAR